MNASVVVHHSWNQVIGFTHRLSSMPQVSIHFEILKINIADAPEHHSYSAGGIAKQYILLCMASPFLSSGIPWLAWTP